MSWEMVALIAIGAVVLIVLFAVVAWALVVRKMVESVRDISKL